MDPKLYLVTHRLTDFNSDTPQAGVLSHIVLESCSSCYGAEHCVARESQTDGVKSFQGHGFGLLAPKNS